MHTYKRHIFNGNICTRFIIPADEVMLKHCSHCTAPDLLFSVDGALGVKGALGIRIRSVSRVTEISESVS